MSINAKKELVNRMRLQYAIGDRSRKTEILNTVVAATGYHRKYALSVLREAAEPRLRRTAKTKIYDDTVRRLLIVIWKAANQICSKRLAPFLPQFVETLEKFGHLEISDDVKQKLIHLSPATIDRLLKEERRRHPRGKTTTRPGNLLKQKIKVRTFADWNEAVSGFFECDLVAHCGDHVNGRFLNTLVLTDIATGWTEFAPLLRKSDVDVTAALDAIRAVLPVALLGIDTDNGSEFINQEVFDYCERQKISFTRSRPYKKNDQAHVEQKNGNVIRRNVGYDRFEGLKSWHCLLNLYRVLRLYLNFFQPSCKLLKKERVGSRIAKSYDLARTPFQRMLESGQLTARRKEKLKELHDSLDPIQLFDRLGRLQQELLASAADEISCTELVVQEANLQQQLAQVQSELRAELDSDKMPFSLSQHNSIDLRRKTERLEHSVRTATITSQHANGKSISAIAAELHMSRNTVAKYIKNPDAPRYQLKRPRQRPHTDAWRATVEQLLQTEASRLKGRRPTARHIHRRLTQEHGYAGSENTLRKLIASIRNSDRQTKAIEGESAENTCRHILSMANPLETQAPATVL